MSNVRSVPATLVNAIQATVNKANKRAIKIGCEGFSIDISPEYQKKVSQYADYFGPDQYITMVDITVTGPIIKLSGWTLQGRVDFEDGITVANSRPGFDLPVMYRSTSCNCEHCNIMRSRNSVFIFQHDNGEYKQVGRTCLRDFLGTDPQSTLWAASEYGAIMGDIDDDIKGFNGGRADSVPLLEVMTCAAYAIRLNGFTSVAYANDNGGFSTRDQVSALLFNAKARAEYKPTMDDTAIAIKTIAYVQSEWAIKGDNATEYEHNAVEFTNRENVNIKRIGLVSSLISAYIKAQIKQVEKDSIVNAHVGTIGKRETFNTKYLGENWFDTAYGRMVIARFSTEQGLIVYKGSAPFWPDNAAIGQSVAFMGTVKQHTDYKGTKQTLVQRCKIVA